MNVKERIRKEIEIQKSIEGDKCQAEVLLKFLDAIKYSSQWQAFIDVEFYKTGVYSYQSHRFYYPKEELLRIMEK